MLLTKNLLYDMIKSTELGQNYISALRKKYEAEMEEAKANLALYVNQLVAIGEHSDLMEEHDKWIEKYTNAKDKLSTIEELFSSQNIIKG
jgi:hypothetical protein